MKRILIVALVLLCILSLTACGNSSKEEKNQENQGNTSVSDTQLDRDKKTLEDAGYVVTVISNKTMLSATEGVLSAEDGSLEALINADGGDALPVYIYYFKSASAASKCYNENWSEYEIYKLAGDRIVANDTRSLIK